MSAIETFARVGTFRARRDDATTVRRSAPTGGGSILGWMIAMAERRRSRLALLQLSDDQLKDIGLSRADAYYEGGRAFWE